MRAPNLNKKTISIFVVVLLVGTMIIGMIGLTELLAGRVEAAGGSFGGGDGTAGNPYQITDVLDLQNMSSNLTAYYILKNDIDAGATSSWNSGAGFIPIGNATDPFNGCLDGNGYGITGLYINRPSESHIGLIGYNSATVTNCTVSGSVTGNSNTGALVGYNNFGIVSNCTMSGSVTGYYVGGLVGVNNYGMVTNCTVSGSVTGTVMNSKTGGLIGINSYGTVTNCTVSGSVMGSTWVGGLIGLVYGTVRNCTSYAKTTGVYYSGGLIGTVSTQYPSAIIADCTVFGDTSGTSEIGGLCGVNCKTITNCTVFGNTTGATYSYNIGGLIGTNNGMAKACNVFGRTTGRDEVGGLIGKNVGDAINCTTFGYTSGRENVGGLIGLIGYHTTIGKATSCRTHGDTSGTTNVGGLIGCLGAWFEIKGIAMNCTSFGNISGSSKVGGLVGNNDGVINTCAAYCKTTGNTHVGGLIGYNSGTVTYSASSGNTIGSSDVGALIGENQGMGTYCEVYGDTQGSGNRVGGLVGLNGMYGKITDAASYGDTAGTNDVGGLFGLNDHGGVAMNCTSSGNTSGVSEVGGLIGDNCRIVINCTAFGNTTGIQDKVGGLIGWNEGGAFVTTSTSYGNTLSSGNYIGGLIGWNDDPVTKCNAYGSTTGNTDIGALIGWNNDTATDCTAYGNATGTSQVGGLMGYSSKTVTDCIAYGDAVGTSDIGGMSGYNSGTAMDCVAYGDAVGTSDIGGLIGCNSGTATGCTVYGDASGSENNIGGLIGYNGQTATDCIVYGNATGTSYVGGLMGNSGGTAADCTVYGDTTGTGNDIGGLIGCNSGTATSCTTYGTTTGSGNVGGLVGDNSGIVTSCSSFGKTTGSSDAVGGLIGNNGGTLSICNAVGDVNGNNEIGGLSGTNSGTIENTYSHSDVSGNTYLGGLVGKNSGTVGYSYSTGFVSGMVFAGGLAGYSANTFESCFWDNGTSGCTSSNGGAGRDTIDMHKGETFTSAGWDFDGIWAIEEKSTYPYFADQLFWPVALSDIYSTYENSPFTIPSPGLLSNDYDMNGDSISLASSDNRSHLGLSVTVNPDGGFTYDPSGLSSLKYLRVGETLTDTFTYKITDGSQYYESDPGIVEIIIMGINEAPVTLDDTSTTDEDTVLSVSAPGLLLNDRDLETNGSLSVIGHGNTSCGAHITVNADGGYSYDPTTSATLQALKSGESLVDEFTYNITDGDNGTAAGVVYITVTGLNDAPSITTVDVTTATEDMPYGVDYDALDAETGTLTWSLNTDAGFLSIEGTTGYLNGTPSNSDVGTCWVNVTVSDSENAFDYHNFTLAIINTNDAPVLSSALDAISFDEDMIYIIKDLNDWFMDIDGDTLLFSITGAANLSHFITDGQVIILAPANWCGCETLTFCANDSTTETSTSVPVTVIPVNDAPLNLSIVLEDRDYYVGGPQPALGNATDEDLLYGDHLTFVWSSNESGVIGRGREVNLSLCVGLHLITLNVTDDACSGNEISVVLNILPIPQGPDTNGTDGNTTNGADDDPETIPHSTIAMVVGLLLLLIVVAVVIVFLYLKKKRDKASEETAEPIDAEELSDPIPISDPVPVEEDTSPSETQTASSPEQPLSPSAMQEDIEEPPPALEVTPDVLADEEVPISPYAAAAAAAETEHLPEPIISPGTPETEAAYEQEEETGPESASEPIQKVECHNCSTEIEMDAAKQPQEIKCPQCGVRCVIE